MAYITCVLNLLPMLMLWLAKQHYPTQYVNNFKVKLAKTFNNQSN